MSLFLTVFYPTLILSVLVTARYCRKDAQTISISLSSLDGEALDAGHTISLSQLTELVPALNYCSPNPRNTALTIRGLGCRLVAVVHAGVQDRTDD